MAKRTLASLDSARLDGQRALVRVDFNVPLREGAVADDSRIRAALPTIRHLREHGARVVLCSHLGRPKGAPDPRYSLAPVARALETLLGAPIVFIEDPTASGAAAETRRLPRGGVALVENTRFHPGEEANDPELARAYAALGDLFVNDAFGAAHRAHATTEGVAHLLKPAVSGFLMERELRFLGDALSDPKRPFVAILGGAKVSDKIEVIQNLMKVVDKLLIGGAMAYTFLKAKGEPTGKSLVEDDKLDLARQLMADGGLKLVLPVDHVVAEVLEAGAPNETVETIPDGKIGLDIGAKTIEIYSEVVKTAKTVIWNGPMGVFEKPPFDTGTVALAKAVAESGATSIVGGGDSEKAIKSAGLSDKISHISTGGGASLEFLSGIELPGVAALTEK